MVRLVTLVLVLRLARPAHALGLDRSLEPFPDAAGATVLLQLGASRGRSGRAGRAPGAREPGGGDPPLPQQVQRARALAESSPEAGCEQVSQLLAAHRGPETGVFGTLLTRVELLDAGIGEAAAQGLLRSLESEGGHQDGTLTPPPAAARSCWAAISSINVQYDAERGLALYTHSPHLWDAVVRWNRRVRRDHDLLREALVMFAGLYGVPPSDQALVDLDEAGGFDILFDVLHHESCDLHVAQAAWAGLSDNVENRRVGAALAADHGGRDRGLELMVGMLKKYHGRHAYEPGSPFGLRYESIHTVNGVLFHDSDSKEWLNVAVGEGFMQEVIVTMREEPRDRLTQDNCCQAIALMAVGNATNQERLANQGAIELMVNAVATTEWDSGQGATLFRHVNSCSTGLLAFAQGSTENQDRMLRMGLDEVLDEVMPSCGGDSPWREPWGSRFPWSNVEDLRDLLRDRRAGQGALRPAAAPSHVTEVSGAAKSG